MNCKSCGKKMLMEDIGDGKKKAKCEECGTTEIVDDKGRKYLTSDTPPPARKLLLG